MTTANDVKISSRDDLRATYLLAFDSFSTDPSEVADHISGNTRYARELLGVLVNAKLLLIDTVNGESDVWQVNNPGTYDNNTREDAIAVIDAWLDDKIPVKPTPAPAAKSTSSATRTKPAKNPTGKCLCGCGENVAKSNYRPGHDARHAGQVARRIADPATTPEQAQAELNTLPSAALRLKASGMADRLMAKANPRNQHATVEQIEAAIEAGAKAAEIEAEEASAPEPAPKPRRTRKAAATK